MKMSEIKIIAKNWGIDTREGRSKQDIIRDIEIKVISFMDRKDDRDA